MTERNETLTEVIDGRRGVYGEPRENFGRVAQVWSGIAGADITAEMVPLMLIGYKAVRAAITPDYSDNSDDIEGYLDIFREIVGDDMVHARSVTEYLQKKEQPAEPVEEDRQVLYHPVDNLDFRGDQYLYNQLIDRSGIKSIGELTQLSAEQLLAMPNLGVRRLEKIRYALAEYGLSLRED